MLAALLLACGTSQPTESQGSGFKSVCAEPQTEEQTLTLNAIFDRIGRSDCAEAYQYLSTTKVLDLGNQPIEFKDLSPIQEFTQIEELYLSDSLVIDLSPIAEFKNLKVLHLEHCGVRDISSLQNMPLLEELLLDYSVVADLTPLSALKNLRGLGLRKTKVTSLEPLAQLTKLTSLEISATNISSIEALAQLSSLQIISMRDTKITDLQPLASHPNLYFVDAKNTEVQELTPLAKLSTLKVLDISKTQVSDLSSLKNSSDSLIEVNVYDAKVPKEQCTPFGTTIRGCNQSSWFSFEELCNHTADYSFLTQVSLSSLQAEIGTKECKKLSSKLASLERFSSDRQFPDPNVFSLFPNIKSLNIPIEKINQSRCTQKNSTPAVKELCTQKQQSLEATSAANQAPFLEHCKSEIKQPLALYVDLEKQSETSDCDAMWRWVRDKEKLTFAEANLKKIEALQYFQNVRELSLDYNEISDLSVLAKLPHLQILWIDDNQVSDLSPLRSLDLLWLSAGDNNLTELTTLQSQKNLHRLWLGGNRIDDISALSDNTSLRKLHLAINNITDIAPLASLTELTSLYLAKNKIRDIEPLSSLSKLKVLNRGMDFDETPLEVQRWFLDGNNIDPQSCPKGDAPAALLLYCSKQN